MAVESETKGSRFYWRTHDPDRRYPGVTSVIDMLPKPFLTRWYANMTADLALDSIDYLQRMADRDRAGAKRYLAGAAKRYTDQRAGIGSKAHDMFERVLRGQSIRRLHPDIEPYRRQFVDFIDQVNPTLVRAEDVAWSDTYRYAGSFDGQLLLSVIPQPDGTWILDPYNESGEAVQVNVLADWKTSKSLWASVAIQLGAYTSADRIISADGSETPMPRFDGGVVLHITPEGWTLVPIYRPELDRAFALFLHLREVFEWERGGSKGVLGAPLARSGDDFTTGTERRA